MKLYIPTEIYFEEKAVRNHKEELAALGRKALLVTGKHSSYKNGSLEDVKQALGSQKVTYVVYDRIEENPSVETVVEAAKLAISEKVDFVVGIGGGSPMDASKAIALLAANPNRIDKAREALYQPDQNMKEALPVAAVPTTSGTGSEVTQYAILTLHDAHTKKSMAYHIFPKLALVDAGYLHTASYAGMVSTCIDALAHMIESYLNTNSNSLNRIYTKEGLQLWGRVKKCLLTREAFEKMEPEEYGQFMQASVYGGMAIAHTGTSIPHGLSYGVTYELGVAHGKAVGLFLPAFLENYENRDDVTKVLALLGFADLVAFRDYMETILGRVEIPDEIRERNCTELLSNPAKLKNYPFPVTKELLDRFYGL